MILSPKHPMYTANDFYREKFGQKLLKISVDGGFTCPNRDGTLSRGGCIFCSERGSGDFASASAVMEEKIADAKRRIAEKWKEGLYMVYFQAFTNTYAPVEQLEKMYRAALKCADAAALSVATRPDCLGSDVIALLKELSRKYYVTVELGLQTSCEKTAETINRQYPNSTYLKAVSELNAAGIDVITHIILGLPGEDKNTMLQSALYAVNAGTKGLKLQLLHVLENTKLAKMYRAEPFRIFKKQEYINTIADIAERLPETVVIHRVTGDAPKDLLIEPRWSPDKRSVLNGISKEFAARGSCQGKYLGRPLDQITL